MWESPGVLKPRAPRVAAAGLLLALVLPSLAACRTSPDVAAYVGDARVTVTELERALDERLADEDVAAAADERQGEFTRLVLGFLVDREIYAEVAERYDVTVRDADVRARIDEVLDDTAAGYRELAQRGVSRVDVVETVRQQLIREQVAEAEGRGDLSQGALRELYAEVREEYAELEFGYIRVPDEATADTVLAELTAAPTTYPAVAARFPGEATLPELARAAVADLPGVVQEEFAAAEPGTGFSVAVEDLGILVGFVTRVVYPTVAELRPQLETEARAQADAAGDELVQQVREDLGVTVNPRYGVLDEDGRLVRSEGGVVEILAGSGGSGTGD